MITGHDEHSGRGQLGLRYQLMLVAAVLLTAYYPISSGVFSLVDDGEIINSLRANSSWTFKSLFMPHMQGGVYYRPIIFLSFYFDKYLFNLDPGFMHIENILLHVLNALLVFWLARQVAQVYNDEKGLLPFFSALAFGLHPIATEPVCWIAGRTDILACTFILLSANCIILFKTNHAYQYAFLSAFFMTLGFLSKEIALAFLPGAFFLAHTWGLPPSEVASATKPTSAARWHSYHSLFVFMIGVGAILFFFILRHFAFTTNDSRIGFTIKSMQVNAIHSGFIFLQTISFYVKKIYFPFPLNFTIHDVDPFYELLGVPVAVLCFFMISKKSRLTALFMTGIFLMAPTLPVALGQIAWTSFAERYIYLSTAFITVPSVFIIHDAMKKMPAFAVKREIIIFLVLAVAAVTTFHRSTVWKDDLAILKDSIIQNPQFHFVRGIYADALALKGDVKNARVQYTIASDYNKTNKRLKGGNAVFQLRYWDMPELGLAGLLVKENRFPEAIDLYEKIIRESHGESIIAIKNILIVYGSMLNDGKNEMTADSIKKKITIYGNMLNNESDDDANVFYWLARAFLTQGAQREALAYFRIAEKKYKAGDAYKAISQKFIKRLESK